MRLAIFIQPSAFVSSAHKASICRGLEALKSAAKRKTARV